ncbi:anaphase-promoting complex subunit cdc27 [Imshaugia aleurites]|uniref:Anaphase-promoting complex subunit cdc27 n=1 Tax=Imshaugia aleurites TaxID=172621 RepID=A0A8H3G460_9LECA|nr:anaphase-promoting complex subunit cdc27 [Imshaugia aleurites]
MWDAFLGLCDLGVNVRMPNIFKMTPEMMSILSSSTNEETPLGILDESPPSNALSQSQVNVNTANQPPSSNDPFSISKNRINGDVRNNAGNLALFEKFNSKKNNTAPIEPIIRPDPHVFDTPTGPPGSTEDSIFLGKEIRGRPAAALTSTEPPLAPPRKERTLPGLGMDFSIDAPPKMRSKSRSKGDSGDQDNSTISRSSTTSNGAGDLKRTVSGKAPQATAASSRPDADTSNDPGAPQRRSQRLFNHMRTQSGRFAASTSSIGAKESRELKKAKATGTKGRSANTFNVGRVVSGNRKHGDPMDIDSKEPRPIAHSGIHTAVHKPMVNEKVKEMEGVQQLLDLFMKLGSGYFALSHYQCQDALRCFNSVSPSQRDTPWVLAQIGRAYYEQASYLEAEKTFARIKTMAPSRLEGMEVYSTTLWHLKSDIDLAFLAHEIIDIDRNSPQAWCAVGNSFSLQRDHEQALKCFKRATQLDPKFAYAFTLQGHEHVANEEYDKALSAYRSSIAAENRHYNAWYGLGKVFEKQGKYAFAEQHYRTAASINPTNAVLVCCIGNILERMKNPKAALIQYSRACELSEKTSLCRFKKARVLVTLQEPERALVELRVLKDSAPDEANVHFLLGRVYKQLRQKGSAIRHFTMAMTLDPKASSFIKEAMEQMEDDDDDDDM